MTSVGDPALFEMMEKALSELAKMIEANDLSKNPEAFKEKAPEFAIQLEQHIENGQAMHITIGVDGQWPDRKPDHWYPCLSIEYQGKDATGSLALERA